MRSAIKIFVLPVIFTCFSVSLHAQKPTKKKEKKDKTQVQEGLSQDKVKFATLYGDAVTQKIIGNYKESLQLFLACLREDPKSAAANYEIADILVISKQYEASLPYIETAVKQESTNKWYLMRYAETLVELKKYKESEKVFVQLVALEPSNYDYSLDLANVFILQKDYKSAIGVYDDLEKKLGVNPEISVQKQKLYDGLGKYKEAVREMEKLIEAFPNDAEYYGMLAELYLAHGKKEDAIKMYEKVLEKDPENPIIHLALANYYQESGDAAKSLDYLKLSFGNPDVSIDDKIKILLSYYDISGSNNTRKKEAFELVEILLKTHSDDPKSYSIKGDFLLRERKLEEARDAFIQVTKLDNSRYPVWEQLLMICAELGQWDTVVTISSKALEIFPTQPVLYFYNGYGHYQLKQYQQAADAFVGGKDLVIENDNLKIQLYSGMGDAYHKLKNYKASDAAFENALLISQTNVIVLNNYAFYLSERGEQLEKAKELSGRATRLEPKNATFLDTYAWVLFKSGDLTLAKETIEDAIRYGGSKSGEILEHYGDILFKSGDTVKALEQWQNAKLAGGDLSERLDEKIRQKKLIE